MKFGTTAHDDKPKPPIYLDDPSQMLYLPDGKYTSIHRPLAMEYAVPNLGTEAHGVDSDVKTADYSPINLEGDNDSQTVLETEWLVPPVAIPVSIVPSPTRSIVKLTRMFTVFERSETYAATAGLDVPDPTTMQLVAPAEDERTSLHLMVQQAVVGTDQYAFYVTTNPNDFKNGVYLKAIDWAPASASAFRSVASEITLYGKNAVYAAIVPRAVYDNTKTNMARLTSIAEYETLANTTVE